ncbi:MAG TPA: FkbM family methyltransferase [Vicinamibacterales bacterium]|nr:FkbM family methyltransferase [Vicinamibacterales bacterium]
MRTLTSLIAVLLLTARRRGVRGVPRFCGRALYLVMRLRHRRLPRAAAVARTRPASATVAPGPVDTVRIAGLTWSIPSDDRKPGSLSDRTLHRDLPLADILRTRAFARGGVMIDIGANIGTTSITRLLLGDVDRIYGVEPDPANFACLQRTIRDNGLEDYVMVDRVALGETDGEADLLVASRIGRHRLLASGAAGRSTIRVPTMRLDTWTQRLGADLDRVRYVKCDTQGWEAHVVAGATALLARRAIRWEMEICPGLLDAAGSSVDELCAMLAPHFEWFVDLRADDETLDRRATAELAAAVQAAVAGGKNYTNVVLSN